MAIRVPKSDMNPKVYVGAQGQAPSPTAGGQRFQRTNKAVQRLLQDRREREWQEREVEAMREVTSRAVQSNQEGGFVPEEEGLAPRYQEQYRKTAETVYKAEVDRDASAVATELAQRNAHDSEGFAREWDSYMAGQLDGLEDQSPALAYDVEAGLNQVGLKTQNSILEAEKARANREQELRFSRTLQQAEADQARHLLNTGDEERYYDFIEQNEATIRSAVSNGLYTVAEGESKITRTRERLTEEYARGVFGQALRGGDVGQAKSVVRQLRAGKWYDDLDDGRALADDLAGELEDRLEGVASERGRNVSVSLDYLNRQAARAELGGGFSPDDPEYQANLNFVLANGTPNQRTNAIQARTEAAVQNQYGQNVRSMTRGEINQARANILATADQPEGGVDASVMTSMVNMLDKRKQDIQRARQTGDWMSLMPDLPADAPPERREAARARVRRIAEAEGGDPSAVPYYSQADYDTFNDRISENRGDPEALGQTLETLFQPARNQMERIGLARRLENDEAKALASMAGVLGPEVASQLTALSAQGARVDEATRREIGGLDQNDMQDLQLTARADTLAFGDSTIRNASVNTFENAYWSLAADAYATNGGDANAAHTTAKETLGRQLGALQPVELVNGVSIPTSMLDDQPSGAAEVQAEINDTLESHPAFKTYREDENLFGRVVPVPLENGEIGFVNRNSPRQYIIHNDEVVRVNRGEVATRGREQAEDERIRQQRVDAMSPSARLSRWLGGADLSSRVAATSQVAEATGGDARLDSALLVAAEQTPSEAAGARAPHTLMNPEWAQLVENDPAYERAFKQREQSRDLARPRDMWGEDSVRGSGTATPNAYTNATGSTIGSSVLLQNLRDQYGDMDKALAAYWMGPGAMKEVERQATEDNVPWEARVPNDAMQFVERVREEYGRGN